MSRPQNLAWDEPCPNPTCVRTGPHSRCRSTLAAALLDDTFGGYARGGIVSSAGTGMLPGSRYTYPSTASTGSALVIGGSVNGRVITYNPASSAISFATYSATPSLSAAEPSTSTSTVESYALRHFTIYDFAADVTHTFATYVLPGTDEDKASEFVHTEWRAGRLSPIRTNYGMHRRTTPTTF